MALQVAVHPYAWNLSAHLINDNSLQGKKLRNKKVFKMPTKIPPKVVQPCKKITSFKIIILLVIIDFFTA